MIELQFITYIQSFFGTGGDVEQTEGGRGKQTRQSRENRCSGWSVYFAEDICEQLSMVHWQIDLVTYLRDTSQASRWRLYIQDSHRIAIFASPRVKPHETGRKDLEKGTLPI